MDYSQPPLESETHENGQLQEHRKFEDIIGCSPSISHLFDQIEVVAPTGATVLIEGETGTGKELVARAIHNCAPRRCQPFVKVNCASIPAGLLESELFGYERGAFTGAFCRKIGKLELANRGTLFLDEVGDIPLELQPKLLRVLQEKEFDRLGSTRTTRVDVRVIAATNRDLQGLVRDRQFRRDLFYRLKVFPIFIAPLRERREDIPMLVRHFANRFARRMDKCITTIPNDAMNAIIEWQWPGNVRELENFIERSVIMTDNDTLNVPLHEFTNQPVESPSLTSQLQQLEKDRIIHVLRETNGVVSGPRGAAVRLGLKRTTLASRMCRLGILPRR